eukprot:gene11293-biopygen4709
MRGDAMEGRLRQRDLAAPKRGPGLPPDRSVVREAHLAEQHAAPSLERAPAQRPRVPAAPPRVDVGRCSGGWARGGPARRRGGRSCAGKGCARTAQYQPRGFGGAAAAVSGVAESPRLTYAICHCGAAVSDRRQQAPQGHVQPAPD